MPQTSEVNYSFSDRAHPDERDGDFMHQLSIREEDDYAIVDAIWDVSYIDGPTTVDSVPRDPSTHFSLPLNQKRRPIFPSITKEESDIFSTTLAGASSADTIPSPLMSSIPSTERSSICTSPHLHPHISFDRDRIAKMVASSGGQQLRVLPVHVPVPLLKIVIMVVGTR